MAYKSKYFQEGKHKTAVGASGLTPAAPKQPDTEYSWQRATTAQTVVPQTTPLERLAGQMAADSSSGSPLLDTLRQGIAAAQEIGRRRAAETASAAKATLAPYLSGGSGRAQPLQASGLLPGRTVTALQGAPAAKSIESLADIMAARAQQQAKRQAQQTMLEQLADGGLADFHPLAPENRALLESRVAQEYTPTIGQRLSSAGKSIANRYAGMFPALWELGSQYGKNRESDAADPERARLLQENALLNNRLTAIRQGYGNAAWGSEEEIRAQYKANLARLQGDLRTSTPADPNGFGMRKMSRGGEYQAMATAGMEGVPKRLADTGLSIAGNAPALAANAVLPGVGIVLMGVQAAADKGAELNERGLAPEESLVRGAVSGGIELATEKFSIDNFLEIAKGVGAKNAVKNILRQAGVEASEESTSYLLNYIADKAARDPNAEFSLAELANSAAVGALSGGFYGGVGTVVNALGTNGQKNYQYLKERDGGTTPDFDRQYEHYYNQARAGLAEDKIAPYPTQTPLDPIAQQSARYAGQNDGNVEARETVQKLLSGGLVGDTALDRALSFSETRAAIAEKTGALPETPSQARKAVREWQSANTQETAKTSKPAPGLVRDGYSAHLDAQAADRLDRIAKRAGVSVAFSDRLGDAAGEYRDGRITLRTGTENPEMRVLVHELTHHLETSGDYQALSDSIVKFVETEKGVPFAELIRQQQDEYAGFGDTLTEDGARRELIANFAQDYLFTDERSIRRLARENRSLVQKIRDWLHAFAVRLRGSAEEKFLLDAEKRYIRALESAEGRQTGETQYKFMGHTEDGTEVYETSEAVKQLSYDQRIKKFLEQMVQASEGQSVTFEQNGGSYAARFDEISSRKNIYGDKGNRVSGNSDRNGWKAKINLGAEGDLLSALENMAYTDSQKESGKNGSGHKKVSGWDYYTKTVQIDGKVYELLANVSQSENGNRVYQVRLRENKNKTAAPIIRKVNDHGFESGEAVDNSITQPAPDGKGKNPEGINGAEETAYSVGDFKSKRRPASNGSSVQKGGARSAATSSDTSITQPALGGKGKNSGGQKSQGASFRELERRAEVIEYLRGQMKRTKGLKADAKAVKTLAGELVGEYSSGYDKAALSTQLQSLYDTYANRTDAGAFTELQQAARELAHSVLEQSSVLNDGTAEDYSRLRGYLKETPLAISDADKASVPGGFGEFRKAHRGKIRLANDGLAVDTAYMELNADFGEALFPADITHPADQLQQIADVLDGLKPVYENPYARNMNEASAALADDLLTRLFKTPQAKPTFADRQAANRDAKIEKLMEQNRERVRKAVKKERQAREKQVSALKEHYAGKDAARRDRASRSELRRKISRHAGQLSKKLLSPTDTQHVPESLRTTVAALLDSINLETTAQLDPATGKRTRYQTDPVTGKYLTRPVLDAHGKPIVGKLGGVKMEYVSLETGDPTKRTEAFRKLREEYRRILEQEPEIMVDPDLDDNLLEVEGMAWKRLDDMGVDELETVWKVLKAVENSVSNAGKLLRQGRFQTVRELGAALEAESKKRSRARVQLSGALDKIDSTVNLDMMAPYDYFHALGSGGESLYKSLRQAFDQKVRDQKAIQDFSGGLLDGVEVGKWSGKKAKTKVFETSGGRLEMTPAQVMSLYKLMQRPQAVEHVLKGGIRPTAIRKGAVERTAGAPVHVTLEDVQKIVSTLTDEQKRVADGFGRFMSSTLSEWGNETSMQLYGYKKFREENYFPIQSDKNYTKAELGQDGLDTRVKQKGWTKSTVKGANNAVMLEDIFDVFTRHADEMSTYHAFLPTLEDMSRVFNFRYIDESGSTNGSVKQTIDHILGKHGQDYFRKLFNDLNGGIRSEGGSKLLGNFKAAAVGGNLRVVVQQPTAFFRAYAVMDAKYLAGGAFRKGDFQEMVEHSPIAQWKDWGYYQLDLGRTTKEVLLDQQSAGQRVTEFFMKPAGAMDNLTWTRLWNACKLEIEDKTSLKKGSETYWQAVSERFDEVIDRTQVVDSVLHRSQMMRSTDGLTRMYTSFMAEPTKTYNLMRSTGVDLLHGKKGAGKAFVRASAAVLVSSAATAAAAAIIDAMRSAGGDDDKGYFERWKESFIGNFADQINPLGWNPVLKDIFSIFQGYDAKRTDMTLIADVVKAFSALRRAQSGEGKVTTEAAMAELLLKLSKVSGLPVANIKRDVTAAVNTALDGLQAHGVNTYGVRFRWDMFKTAKNDSTANYWMDQAFAARDSGDTETANKIFQMLQDKQLRTAQEIQDYEKSTRTKDRNELLKLAFEAKGSGDTEGLAAYTDALRAMGYDEDEIKEALESKERNALYDSWNFKTEKSDTYLRLQEEAYKSKAFESLGDEQRERFEKNLASYSLSMTKDSQIEDFDMDSKWMIACRDAKKACGLSESQFLIAYSAQGGIQKGLVNREGETIENSRSLLKMQAIYAAFPNLPDKQRAYLYEACGVGKSVRHYNRVKVEEELRKMEQKAKK